MQRMTMRMINMLLKIRIRLSTCATLTGVTKLLSTVLVSSTKVHRRNKPDASPTSRIW
jgi:hypothetical protein